MTTAHVDVIDRSVQQTNIWLEEVAEACGVEDRRAAYRVLRAFLHALRDRITVDEAAQLAAQLPDLVRGIYYEGWDPSGTPQKYHEAEAFLHRVADEALLSGTTDASYAVAGAAAVLRRHVSEGEIVDVLAVLPGPVRELLEPAAEEGG
jgi:uncharacterized protein (DUF2267 family)